MSRVQTRGVFFEDSLLLVNEGAFFLVDIVQKLLYILFLLFSKHLPHTSFFFFGCLQRNLGVFLIISRAVVGQVLVR